MVPALLDLMKKAGRGMNFRNKLSEERGQGLVEYTFIVLLVALVLWLGVKGTNASDSLIGQWNKITDCVGSPFSCTSAS